MNVSTMYAKQFISIRPAKLLFYLRAMRSFGYHEKQVLEGTGLSRSQLEDDYFLVDTLDYIKVILNMIDLTGWHDLAFRLGEMLEPGDLGVLGAAFSAAENAYEATNIWQEYNWLFFGNLFSMKLERHANIIKFKAEPRIDIFPELLQYFVEEKINVDNALFARFNNFHNKRLYYRLTYPQPHHAHKYEELMGIQPTFSCDEIAVGVEYSREYFEMPFPGRNSELLALCISHLDQMSSIAQAKSTLTAKTMFLVRENLPTVLSVDELSKYMGMSYRTFNRRLEGENTSYNKIVASVRENMAKNYLISTDMAVSLIADMLGFEDSSSLCRAFKEWTGMTATEYKASHGFRIKEKG